MYAGKENSLIATIYKENECRFSIKMFEKRHPFTQAHGFVPPFLELVFLDLPHFSAGRVSAVVQVVHSKSRPVGGLFLEVLLRRQFLAAPRFTLLYPVAVSGVEVSLQNEISPAPLALAEPHIRFQQLGEFQLQDLIHLAELVAHPEVARDCEQRTYLLWIGVVMFRELVQLIGDGELLSQSLVQLLLRHPVGHRFSETHPGERKALCPFKIDGKPMQLTVEMEAFCRTPLPQQVGMERLVKAELQQLQVLLLQLAEICVIVLYGFLPV